MPYYQRTVLTQAGSKSSHKLRTIPLIASIELMSQGQSAEQALTRQPSEPKQTTQLDELTVMFTQSSLSKQAQECANAKCCDPISSSKFATYVIHRDRQNFKGMYSEMFISSGGPGAETASMVCRIFKPTSLIDPNKDVYLKILRHLSNKNSFVIGTLDMFVYDSGSIYLFMEYADAGNAMDYLRANKSVSEQQMCLWAQNIYQAMDFLGGMAISHRAIYPKHLLLRTRADKIEAKLGGFRDAIVYWDPVANDIIDQPCKPLSQATSFHAPEMFGSLDGDEYYNPVDADIWSYGCTMFFLVGRVYPFMVSEENLELVIRNAIAELSMTDAAKYWLFGLMRTNTAARTDFGMINKDEWFYSA